MVWLDRETAWQGPSCGKPGRPATYSDAAVQGCLMMKVPLGAAASLDAGVRAERAGLVMAGVLMVPDYSTVNRCPKRLDVQITAWPSRGGLHLLVDSTGIKMLGKGEWKTRKHGAEYRRQWCKVHLRIDTETLEIRAIEETDNRVGDAPMLPELLGQIPAEKAVLSVHMTRRPAARPLPSEEPRP